MVLTDRKKQALFKLIYLPIALKYRRQIRLIANKIPVDIFPIKKGARDSSILLEIAEGDVVYER